MEADHACHAVSTALNNTSGDLLNAIDTLREKWSAELNVATSKARVLHNSVLQDRQSLRNSLSNAAALWHTLRASHKPHKLLPTDLDDEQLHTVAIALQNVSQTLKYLDFFEDAPAALEKAHKALLNIIEDGTQRVVPGNASSIYEIHATLAAVERVRDLAQLEHSSSKHSHESDVQSSVPEHILRVNDTRKALDDFLMNHVFADILTVSQRNPRFLVAAMRIVQQEEARDEWWQQHLASRRLQLQHDVDNVVRRRDYKTRMFDSIARRINAVFLGMDKHLGLVQDAQLSSQLIVQPDIEAPLIDADNTLDVQLILQWIDARIAENGTVQRYVVPCVPQSFAIADFYEHTFHHRLMRTLLGLLRKVTETSQKRSQQDSMMKIMLWYSSYRQGLGRGHSGIDAYLGDSDRQQLVDFMRNHVANTIGARICAVVNPEVGQEKVDGAAAQGNQSTKNLILVANRDKLASAELPEEVFDCINELVSRASSLGIGAVRKAVAVGIADSLKAFQANFSRALDSASDAPVSREAPKFICAVANNMAGCLEYAEELRDNLSNSIAEKDRAEVVRALESTIDGFRKLAVLAISDLIQGLEDAVSSLTCKLFAPHTGTDTILDIVGTLEDSMSVLEENLLPYHFEQLATECLRNVVAHYVAPFVQLGFKNTHNAHADEAARVPRGTGEDALPVPGRYLKKERIFHERSASEERSEAAPNRPRRRPYAHGGRSLGLMMMSSAAVVAQIDKDIENLTVFFQAKVQLYQRKQLQAALEPMHAIRALYTCSPTPTDLVEAYHAARAAIGRAMHSLIAKSAPSRRTLSVRAAEVIWSSRFDVNNSIRDEAVIYASEYAPNINGANRSQTLSPIPLSSGTQKDAWSARGVPLPRSRISMDSSVHADANLLWAPSAPVQRGVP